MKTIGLIGGMSWESTVTYYRIVNEIVKSRLGGFHSAKCLLYSVDFQEIESCQAKGDWEKSGDMLAEAAVALERGGADFIVICTNTMHKVVGQIQKSITIPILHIADATADELIRSGIRRVGLLGTKYTMQQDFYKARLADKGLEVLIPDDGDVEIMNKTIYQELCLGKIIDSSRDAVVRIIADLAARGAEGIILGCTEIGLLVTQSDTDIPLFDTTVIHAEKAALLSID